MLLSFIIVIGVFHYQSKEVFAVEKSEKEESLLYLFNKGIKLENIKSELEDLSLNLNIKTLKEISMLKIKSNTENIKKAKNFINTNYQNIISDEIDDVHISTPMNNNQINIQNSHLSAPMNNSQLNIQSNLLSASFQNNQWNIEEVTNNYQTYNISKGSKAVKIGIIDSGIDISHPALKDNIVSIGKSFISDETSDYDYLGHGTMVAGIIAANDTIRGVGPQLGLVPYKVFDSNGADSSNVISAIIEAVNDNVDIINVSLNTTKIKEIDTPIIKAYERAFQYAKKNNTIIVASAGNESKSIDRFKDDIDPNHKGKETILNLPGGHKDVITVAATAKENKPASYSNFGNSVDISAPGGELLFTDSQLDLSQSIVTTYPLNNPQSLSSKSLGLPKGYEPMIGTSLAAPHVAGTLGVMISHYENKYDKKPSVNYLKKHLYHNVKPIQGKGYGKGIVNLYQSLVNM